MITEPEATEIQRIFAALAIDATEPGAKVLASLDPPRVLWANEDAAGVFGTRDTDRLTRVIFGRSSAARPLATRLGRLTPASSPHFERIAVSNRFRRFGVILACRAVPYRTPSTVLLQTPAARAAARAKQDQDGAPAVLHDSAQALAASVEMEPRQIGFGELSEERRGFRHPEQETVADAATQLDLRSSELQVEPDSATEIPALDALPDPEFSLPSAPMDAERSVLETSSVTAFSDADDLAASRESHDLAVSELVRCVEVDSVAAEPLVEIPAVEAKLADVFHGPAAAVEAPVERNRRPLELAGGNVMPLRDFAGAGPSKVIHLATFKAGQPTLSGRAVPRRDPAPPAVEAARPDPLEVPQWAEAPRSADPAPGDQQLSSHERFNFDEIARALAALPGADAMRPSVLDKADRVAVLPDLPPNEARQRESREGQAWTVLDALPLGILVAQGESLIYANRALLDILGYDRLDEIGENGGLADLFRNHAGHGPAPVNAQRNVVLRARGGGDLEVDARIQSIVWGGSPAVLLSVRRPERSDTSTRTDTAGAPIGLADLEDALDLASAGVAFIDLQGRILSVNSGGERLFGYEQRELLGDTATVLFAADQQAAWRTFFSDFLNTGSGRRSAFRKFLGRKRNGQSIPLALSLRRLDEGRVCIVWQESWHGHAGESELEVLRREAERTSALKSEFLAKVSHEIRTPLNAMLGFTEIILEERFGPVANDRYREYLKDIHTSGTHVVSLVNDLLDLSRIEQGGLELELVPVDVNAVLGACVATLQGQAHRDRVIIRTSFAVRAPVALADQRAFRQIALNLLSNAVKFNEAGGQVIVSSATTEAGQVTVRIRDTGPGMSESEIETAMKPFRQLATPKASAGSGLGLPLTKAMVEASQGSLRISSKPGEGTLVEVTLQRAPEPALSVPAE